MPLDRFSASLQVYSKNEYTQAIYITQMCFLSYMQGTYTLAPVLFNSNVKGKRIRHMPKDARV